jgi:hypothetical protein
MGKMFGRIPSYQETQRHIREAHVLRSRYVRAPLGRLLARCLALLARPRSDERSPVRLRAEIDPGR